MKIKMYTKLMLHKKKGDRSRRQFEVIIDKNLKNG